MLNADTVEKLLEVTNKPFLQPIGKAEDAIEAILVPKGYTVESVKKYLDEYKTKPDRRKGLINACDLQSFTSLTNRFKAESSAIFKKATFGENALIAELRSVLNYNPASTNNADADNGDHKVVYSFPLSEQLKIWLGKNKIGFNQKEFSEFLEDNNADLVTADPGRLVTNFGEIGTPSFATPSKIMELARGIDVRVDEKVTNAYRTSDGSFAIQYTAENKDSAGQPLKLPEWFCLGVPVFQNGTPYQIPLRLRFRVKDGGVTWFFEMYRKNDVLQTAFDNDCTTAQVQTSLPIFNGTPE